MKLIFYMNSAKCNSQILKYRRPNLKNLNRIAHESPKTVPIERRLKAKTKHRIHFQVEPTMFKPRLKFKT